MGVVYRGDGHRKRVRLTDLLGVSPMSNEPNSPTPMTGRSLTRVCVDSADGVRMHSPEAHEAISAELVRLTLGGRGPDRPELRVDLLSQLYARARTVADQLSTSWLAAARKLQGAFHGG